MCICVIFFVIKPFLSADALPINFSYDVGNYYYAVYLFQVVSLVITALVVATIDLSFAGFLSLAAAQVDIFKERLMNSKHEAERNVGESLVMSDGVTVNERVDEEVQKIIGESVVLHYTIIE